MRKEEEENNQHSELHFGEGKGEGGDILISCSLWISCLTDSVLGEYKNNSLSIQEQPLSFFFRRHFYTGRNV